MTEKLKIFFYKQINIKLKLICKILNKSHLELKWKYYS